MKDFLSIQEFSNISGVEVSTLRYWDEIGIFSPITRNPENNYRCYSLVQVIALNFVTTLSDLEIPLKTIAELRKERNPEKFLRLLDKQEKQLDLELRNLRERSSIIHARRELINYGLKVNDTQVAVLHREDRALILWPRNEYQEGETFIEPLTAFVNQASRHHINLGFPVGGYHESMETFMAGANRPDHFFSADPIGTHTREAGKYLVGFSRGYYGEFGDLPKRMADYAEEHSLILSGPVYSMYLHDEICTQDPSEYLVQSCVAVSKQKGR